ncbi:DinB family protein [Portibacter lacus]|uniref:Damage-inducible protein DinB n=1 Tax=Portibacter lacus TaxID=1099794 RepID=A0AA37SL31_9BACT|nr:DinB family protein [Portibacter lacus]GLR15514.1 hypothetical protein GCM10007940_01290 [Portibacter lacus]
MNQRYIDYATYNIWANNRLINDLSKLDESKLTQEVVGSFPSIRSILLHIWNAEAGWLSRLQTNDWGVLKSDQFKGNSKELFTSWQATSEQFRKYVETTDLERKVNFEHKGEQFSIPAREIAQTVFNHGSYHRGQVVMCLRQLGVTEITQTDYIEWVREQARAKAKI